MNHQYSHQTKLTELARIQRRQALNQRKIGDFVLFFLQGYDLIFLYRYTYNLHGVNGH